MKITEQHGHVPFSVPPSGFALIRVCLEKKKKASDKAGRQLLICNMHKEGENEQPF